jgi:hypothetical protein
MQLKGMFKNCAELIRKRWEWLEATRRLRLDYLGYDFYPEENEGVQDQAFRWRPLLSDSSSASIHLRLFWSPK